MKGLVVDASVSLVWFLSDETDQIAMEVLQKLEFVAATVPPIWTAEVGNALTTAERRSRITEAETSRILTLLRALPIQTDDMPVVDSLERVIDLARRHELTAYDAAYLELAIRLDAELATLDRQLMTAAEEAGVSIFG